MTSQIELLITNSELVTPCEKSFTTILELTTREF